MKVQLLEQHDIFDFYGCEYLLRRGLLDSSERPIAEARVREIHERYVTSASERIKAEAKFLGIEDLDVGFSIKKMLDSLGDMIINSMQKQAETMMNENIGFNLMGSIVQARQMAGDDLSDVNIEQFGIARQEKEVPKNTVDPEWFKREKNGAMWEDPKWREIAEAFVSLEDASSLDEMMNTIDFLNDLQHNSFHLLIDLQTGRMLEGQSKGETHGHHEEARSNLQEILNIKCDAKSPMEFAGKMSSDIRKLVVATRAL